MSSKGSRIILIFSKGAERGNVKTRLQNRLGDDACLSLHLSFLKDTLATCLSSGEETILYLAGEGELPFWPGIPVRHQSQGNLGHRMQSAFEEQLSKFQEVVIVGTDCPLLGVPLLKQAFEALKSHNCVLGPSEDGGYYLIGLRRMISEIFRDIPWSTPGVLDVSLQRHPAAHLLPLAYDVDESADLDRHACRHGGRKTRARTPYNRMDFGFRPALSSNPQSEIRNPQSSYARWQDAECPGAISRRTGSSVLQRSIAIGQRG